MYVLFDKVHIYIQKSQFTLVRCSVMFCFQNIRWFCREPHQCTEILKINIYKINTYHKCWWKYKCYTWNYNNAEHTQTDSIGSATVCVCVCERVRLPRCTRWKWTHMFHSSAHTFSVCMCVRVCLKLGTESLCWVQRVGTSDTHTHTHTFEVGRLNTP